MLGTKEGWPETRNLCHTLMGYHHHHHPQASQAGEVLHSPGIWSTLEYPYCLAGLVVVVVPHSSVIFLILTDL